MPPLEPEGRENARYSGRGHLAMNGLLEYGHRSHSATTNTGDPFQAKLAVWSSLPYLDIELPFPGFQSKCPPLHMAGGAHADLDGVFSRRGEAKLVVKGGNAIDGAVIYLKIFGDLQHCLPG